jgi:hypothetical protein
MDNSNVTTRGNLTAPLRRDCMILRCDGMMRNYDLAAPKGNGSDNDRVLSRVGKLVKPS